MRDPSNNAILSSERDAWRSAVARAVAGSLLAVSLAAAGCNRSADKSQHLDPVEVGVITLAPSAVALTRELPGRVSAYRVAEVRARVTGIILKRHFTEGNDVKAGERLFEIDPAPYRAARDIAQAQMARAQAAEGTARLLAQRELELVKEHAVSKQECDNAVAAQKVAEADVEAGRAAVETATINLGYTSVTSPVTGRIGRSFVTEGAFVKAEQATLLAIVQQLDPVYVDVTQSSMELLRLRRELEKSRLRDAGSSGGSANVTVMLEDGTAYEQIGTLQFSDVTVEPSTGSVILRALFPNPERVLLPGMFVTARLDQAMHPQALLVPQRAVSRDQKGQPVVMIVNSQGKVEQRSIETSQVVNESWLISSGLSAGDQVIVDGLQKVRPGVPVKPVSVEARVSGPESQGGSRGDAAAAATQR